jgi:hypothetical protein
VQVLPTFTRGLRLFDPGWQKKGTFGVFNRLMKNEGNNHPITVNTEWISYAAIYLTLAGDDPSIPTDSDSIQANWNLAARHGTTPVVTIMKDGSATIACTDVAEGGRTLSWKLYFNKFGQIANAERLELRPLKVLTMQTANETQTLQVPAPPSQPRSIVRNSSKPYAVTLHPPPSTFSPSKQSTCPCRPPNTRQLY